ncbi:hypothetical protein RAH33_04575 [Pseudomonas aeruginosa]|nr:hypothetical protein RAH33_04575 [Pseudomonas aeruginosa]
MVRWCQAQGKDWRLLYAVRERQRAAFLAELMTLGGERTRLHCSDEGDPLDSTALIAGLGVMSRDVVESVEGYAANRRVVSVVVVEVEPAGQRQASFGL